jgi:hypothetical protein
MNQDDYQIHRFYHFCKSGVVLEVKAAKCANIVFKAAKCANIVVPRAIGSKVMSVEDQKEAGKWLLYVRDALIEVGIVAVFM